MNYKKLTSIAIFALITVGSIFMYLQLAKNNKFIYTQYNGWLIIKNRLSFEP